ncbi:unnamed protein product [Oppiella nova]|uniref:SGNH hydrolase-type esterase domain-containing protein n=1 Tax=Oppiella nova TaxID=334625 RepID=A0A7R9QQS6_9ACAR|nr:unnamed protein product [Oppiella nova]CAG2170871.1 unnamed protein product [Oppiella nova]
MFRSVLAVISIICIELCTGAVPWEPVPTANGALHIQLLLQTNLNRANIRAFLIGSSGVQFWQNEGNDVSYGHLWDTYYLSNGIYNYGVGGDTTSNVLWRIQNYELDGINPKVFVVGLDPAFNTMFYNKPSPSAYDVYRGLVEIINELRIKFPNSKVLIIGFPYSDPSINERSQQINSQFKSIVDGINIMFIDLTPVLTNSNGQLNLDYFKDDHVHLNSLGLELTKIMFKLIVLTIICVNVCGADVQPWEPQPGNEGWLQRHKQLQKYTEDNKSKIKAFFIGASITDNWHSDGKEVWDSYFAPKGAANYGIGGDTTSNVLWRIQNKEIDGLNPKVIVMSCGPGYNTMNKNPSPSGPDILRAEEEIIKELRAKFPTSKVIIIGHTPYIIESISERSKQINVDLKKFADEKDVFFMDLSPHMVDSKGQQLPQLFKSDHLHFTPEGYKVWQQVMGPLFERLMK